MGKLKAYTIMETLVAIVIASLISYFSISTYLNIQFQLSNSSGYATDLMIRNTFDSLMLISKPNKNSAIEFDLKAVKVSYTKEQIDTLDLYEHHLISSDTANGRILRELTVHSNAD